MDEAGYYALIRERLLEKIQGQLDRAKRRGTVEEGLTEAADDSRAGGWRDFTLVDVAAIPRAGVFVFFRSISTSQLYSYAAFVEGESDQVRIQQILDLYPDTVGGGGWREFDVFYDEMVFRIGSPHFGSDDKVLHERDVIRLAPLEELEDPWPAPDSSGS